MAEPSNFATRLDARVAEALDRRIANSVSTGKGRRIARLTAFALVTPVHLTSLALLAGGVALAVTGDGWWSWVLALLVLSIAWLVRPRLYFPADPDSILVDPEQAPELTAVVCEVARLLGTRPPDEIRFDTDFNAHVAPRGLLGRRLVLGAPLWAALGPQERLSLLGHEIGHLAHGDLLSLRYVASAHRTLHSWVDLLDPAGTEVFENDTPLMVRAVTAPPRWVVLGYLRLLRAVNAAASRRQELYADLAGALVAGTDAAVSDHEISLLDQGIQVVANRAAMDAARPPLGEAIAARVRSYDAGQREAARRAAAQDRRSVDASHPPTIDRLRLIESVAASEPAMVLDLDRSQRIDDELVPVLGQAFKQLGDAYRYVQ